MESSVSLRVRSWPLWQLPGWLACWVTLVTVGYAAAIAVAATTTTYRAHDGVMLAALLGFGVLSIELTHRAGEPAGFHKDVHGIWLLPIALLLPPVYGLTAPIVKMALTQWRVRRNVLHRRVYTAAVVGLSYGAASAAFHFASTRLGWIADDGSSHGASLHWAGWLVLALCCAVARTALNKFAVMIAVKGSDPSMSIRHQEFSGDPLYNDLAELAAGTLLTVAIAATGSVLVVMLALPMVTLLQRSLRHAQLAAASRVDQKTGLLNAVTWQREAHLEITRASRTRTPLALAMIDVDHFKRVNDTYGHLAGDAVLAALSATMRAVLRDYDLIGRFGGEEFAVLLPQTTAEDAERIVERLRKKLSQIIVPAINGGEQVPLQVTVSIGVAMLESSRRDLDEMIAAADAEMYHAKARGRNRISVSRDPAATVFDQHG
ncbi:MAG TPA: GGDEF domain-containing protein [Streptosporangiaceae bacterium]